MDAGGVGAISLPLGNDASEALEMADLTEVQLRLPYSRRSCPTATGQHRRCMRKLTLARGNRLQSAQTSHSPLPKHRPKAVVRDRQKPVI